MKFIKMTSILASLLLLKSAFAGQHLLQPYLLKPTGEYKVGFQDIRLVHGTLIHGSYLCPGQTDLFYVKGKNEKDFGQDNQVDFCREMMLRIYYPTQKKIQPTAFYYHPAIEDLQEMIRKAKVPGVTNLQIAALSWLKTYSVDLTGTDKKILNSTEIKNFPVLIFDPGSGVEAQQYENTITELVSHGYIVFAINNTFIGSSILFPDGRLVHTSITSSAPDIIARADHSALNDIMFVRSLIKQDKVGLFGHSLGGISVVKAVRDNPTLFQAAISFDTPPVAFTTRTYSESELAGFPNTPFLRFFAAEWRNLANIGVPKDAKFELFENNYYALLSPSEDNTTFTNHMSFADYSTLQYQPVINSFINFAAQGTVGDANGLRISQLINTYTLAFFDQYLKGERNDIYGPCKAVATDTMLTCHQDIK